MPISLLLPALLLATPLELQRGFELCLEAEADRAARAGMAEAEFALSLPDLCRAEERALVAAVAAERADRDPALTRRPLAPRAPSVRAIEAAAGYARGLRGVVAAGYGTLLQLRGPAPDPRRYPYAGLDRGDVGPVPPLGDDLVEGGVAVPPLGGGPSPRRITVSPDGTGRVTTPPLTPPAAAAAPASPPTAAPAPVRPSPIPRRIRVPSS